jgi:hypothetical protein
MASQSFTRKRSEISPLEINYHRLRWVNAKMADDMRQLEARLKWRKLEKQISIIYHVRASKCPKIPEKLKLAVGEIIDEKKSNAAF